MVTLFLLAAAGAAGQTVPAGWKPIHDAKGQCQISVPENWTSGADNTGSAVFQDATVAIAVVTSQPGQTFKPIADSMLKLLNIPKEKVFENSTRRVFYQDKTAHDAGDPSAISAMVPGRNGTCSSRVVYLPAVTEDTAKKIVLSVGPTPETSARAR